MGDPYVSTQERANRSLSTLSRYFYQIPKFPTIRTVASNPDPKDSTKDRPRRPMYRSYFSGFSEVIKKEGVRGLWTGLSPNLMGNTIAWGLYFLGYNEMKLLIQKGGDTYYGKRDTKPLKFVENLFAASVSGVGVLACTNPLWVVKTRMCLQGSVSSQPTTPYHYKGVWDGMQRIYALEGLRGLYKGFGVGMLGASQGAIQLALYEELKLSYWYFKLAGGGEKYGGSTESAMDAAAFSPTETSVLSGTAKILAAVSTYPLHLIRSRLQDLRPDSVRYSSTWMCVRDTWKVEGLVGFYRGLLLHVFKVTPQAIIVFVTYEEMLKVTKRFREGHWNGP